MANLSVCASVIPHRVETTSGVSSSIYLLATMVMNYHTHVLTAGSNSLDRRWPILGRWFRREFAMHPHIVFWSCGITPYVLGIVPIGFFPWTLSFANLSFVDAPNPLTGHSYLHQTLPVFVGTSGLTVVQSVLLPSTHSGDSLSSCP